MRWLVDAMNVIGSRPDGWWKDRHAAMVRLVEQLEHWASASGEEDITVVFERPPLPAIESPVIEIAHAPRAGRDAADHEIIRLLKAETDPEEIRVVTSDRALAEQVRSLNASVEAAEPFRRKI